MNVNKTEIFSLVSLKKLNGKNLLGTLNLK